MSIPVHHVFSPRTRLALILAIPLLLSACAESMVLKAPEEERIAVLGCLDRCQHHREACNDHARDVYRQCEAGWDKSFRAYRWCLASASEKQDCGYPWWSCAENHYGACTNRYRACRRACAPEGSTGD